MPWPTAWGALGLAHGECNALLLERVVRFNFPAAAAKYQRLADAMGVPTRSLSPGACAAALVERIARLRRRLGITQRLRDMGVARDDLHQLAQFAYQDPCLATNPREADPRAIVSIYEEIY
jgi:alcohol dehydrogenase